MPVRKQRCARRANVDLQSLRREADDDSGTRLSVLCHRELVAALLQLTGWPLRSCQGSPLTDRERWGHTRSTKDGLPQVFRAIAPGKMRADPVQRSHSIV